MKNLKKIFVFNPFSWVKLYLLMMGIYSCWLGLKSLLSRYMAYDMAMTLPTNTSIVVMVIALSLGGVAYIWATGLVKEKRLYIDPFDNGEKKLNPPLKKLMDFNKNTLSVLLGLSTAIVMALAHSDAQRNPMLTMVIFSGLINFILCKTVAFVIQSEIESID